VSFSNQQHTTVCELSAINFAKTHILVFEISCLQKLITGRQTQLQCAYYIQHFSVWRRQNDRNLSVRLRHFRLKCVALYQLSQWQMDRWFA